MSFRDTFTRGSGNQNLQYDDSASMYFIVTLLIVVILPLAINILKSILFPLRNVKGIKQAAKHPILKPKVQRLRRDSKYSFLTFWFFIKVHVENIQLIMLVLAVWALYKTADKLRNSKVSIKGFDPYQTLQLDPTATPEMIKKAYRRLALIYHPDRSANDASAKAKFILISKAYDCLTDQKMKENCIRSGNPDGTSSGVGIALPEFLIGRKNQIKVLGVLSLILVILIPTVLIWWNSRMNEYDPYGMLVKNQRQLIVILNQNFPVMQVARLIAFCSEFQNRKFSSKQMQSLPQIISQFDQQADSNMNHFLKPSKNQRTYPNWIKRTAVLCMQRIQQLKLPPELNEEADFVLKEVPKLLNATVHLAIPFSLVWQRAQKFIGLNTITHIIQFMQYFIQGCRLDDPSIMQLDLNAAELERLTKKKKRFTIPQLQHDPQQLQKFLALMDPERRDYLKQNLQMFPKIKYNIKVETVGQVQITDKDVITVTVSLERQKLTDYAIARNYPFLKQERWYFLLALENKLLHFDKFSFEKNTHTIEFPAPIMFRAGDHKWTVKIMPDCYFGLDIEQQVKFKIIKNSQSTRAPFELHKQDKEFQKSKSFVEEFMDQLNPKEHEQLSDEEEEEESKKEQSPEKVLQKEQKQFTPMLSLPSNGSDKEKVN